MARKDRRPDGEKAGDSSAHGAAPEDVDAAIAGLYGGPLASFVARREALVKSLRSAGRRDDAATVKALRKPKVPAWALDAARLVDPAAVDGLARAVESVADAQSTGEDVRAAITRLRDAQQDLVGAAMDAAQAHDQRVDRSELGLVVRAVAADPHALAALLSGRLVDVPATGGSGGLGGFGEVALGGGLSEPLRRQASQGTAPTADGRRDAERGGEAPGGRDGEAGRRSGRPASSRALAAARRALQRAEAEAASADDAARDAAERAGAAATAARGAERDLALATERADAARRAADDAEASAGAAAARRDETAVALADARDLIHELER